MKNIKIQKNIIIALTGIFAVALFFAPQTTLAVSCPFTSSANDYVVNLVHDTLLSSQPPYWGISMAADVPAGKYKVSVATYDSHSVHGGQNQYYESIYLQLHNAAGTTFANSAATGDIPENSDWWVGVVNSSMNLTQDVKSIIPVHAFIGQPNYNSIYPICAQFHKIDTTPINGSCGSAHGTTVSDTPSTNLCSAGTASSVTLSGNTYSWSCNGSNGGTNASCTANKTTTNASCGSANGQTFDSTPTTNLCSSGNASSVTLSGNTYSWSCTSSNGGSSASCSANKVAVCTGGNCGSNFSVSCSVSDSSLDEGDSTTFTANVSGGTSPYTYDWRGDATGSAREITKRFNNAGSYYVSIFAQDNAGHSATASCPRVVVDDEEDDDLDVSCRVSDTSVKVGDDVTYTASADGGGGDYDYTWKGDIDGDNRRETVSFDEAGTYEVSVKVRSDNGDSETVDCHDVHVTDDNDGSLASISSVYLNQIPSTGPENWPRFGLILSGIALWSAAVAIYFKREKARRAKSLSVNAFKESNKRG